MSTQVSFLRRSRPEYLADAREFARLIIEEDHSIASIAKLTGLSYMTVLKDIERLYKYDRPLYDAVMNRVPKQNQLSPKQRLDTAIKFALLMIEEDYSFRDLSKEFDVSYETARNYIHLLKHSHPDLFDRAQQTVQKRRRNFPVSTRS